MLIPQKRGQEIGWFRLASLAGGRAERFFYLWPWVWLAYLTAAIVLSLMAEEAGWLPRQLSFVDVLWRLFVAGVSVTALAETWLAARLSAAVLQALAESDANTDPANALALAHYLSDRFQGRSWPTGVRFALAYAVILMVWTPVALFFPLLTGARDFWSFLGVDFILMFAMLYAFQLRLGRMLRDAVKNGYPIRLTTRPRFLRLTGLIRSSRALSPPHR